MSWEHAHMTDFAATYDRFLDLIGDEGVRSEVTQHITKMSSVSADSDAYADAHRDFVRVLKSRAPHVLPASWLADSALEKAQRTTHHEELRKDWKLVMEEVGVFSFGQIPTFEDIDKHYGEGDSRKYSKTHNAKPTQRVHGNELGVRHMVVRLAMLPEFRNNIEGLARALGQPADTPYRELVQFLGDESYKQKVTDYFESKFRGAEKEEAVEGTGKAAENFKLSAARARGRRADEHQDATVQTRDTAARVDDARTAASERTGEDKSTADIAELLEGAGDALDSITKNILTAAQGYDRFVRGSTVFNAWERKVKKQGDRIEAAEARFQESGRTDQDLAALAEEVADAFTIVGVETDGVEARLQAGREMREAPSQEVLDLFQAQAERAVALAGAAHSMGIAIEHSYNSRDAAEHDRPFGPDKGEDESSDQVVRVSELAAVYSDLTEEQPAGAAPTPSRRQFQPKAPEREEAAPKPKAPARLQPAAQQAEAPAEETEVEEPAATKEPKAPAKSLKALRAEVDAELERRGIEFTREGYKDGFVIEEMQRDGKSAREVLDALGDAQLEEVTQPVGGAAASETPPEPAPGRVPAGVSAAPRQSESQRRAARRAEEETAGARRVKPALPGMGGKFPAAPKADAPDADTLSIGNMGRADSSITQRLELWRSALSDKIKDPKKAKAATDGLESKLKAVKGEGKDRQLAVVDVLQNFAKEQGLEREDSRVFDTWRSQIDPWSSSNPTGFRKPMKPPMRKSISAPRRLSSSPRRLPFQ